MNLEETLSELELLGSDKVRAQNSKQGAGENQFGVRLGDIRKVAKRIKSDHGLALELWDTQNVDARFLAILLLEPKRLSSSEMDRMVRSVSFVRVADWLNSYVVKLHPESDSLYDAWMKDEHPMAARAGWNLTAERIAKRPEGLDLVALLDRIESELATAAPEPQWTMNFCLAAIGIHHADLRERAMGIGEALGIYRDYPTPKGCTPPFAPLWIGEMVNRQS